MTNSTLEQFEETFEKEIQEYEAIEELYTLKQAMLVQGKSGDLWAVDSKIVDRMDKIKKISIQRKEVAKYLGNENLTISEAIERAKIMNDNIAEKLQSQKTKLSVLSSLISLHENKHRTNQARIIKPMPQKAL